MEQVQEAVVARDGAELESAAAALIVEWERIARRKLLDAEHERDPMGRRLIDHGAFCYFNCAEQLKAAVRGGASPPL